MLENEDDDPVGAPNHRPARERYTEFAVDVGLARASDPLDQKYVDFGAGVAQLCASVGDGYAAAKGGGTAGDLIRQSLGLQRSWGVSFAQAVAGEPLTRDPRERFTELALRTGLLRPGDQLDQNEMDFATHVVDWCATKVESFGDGEAGGNAAEHIRAELYE